MTIHVVASAKMLSALVDDADVVAA
jgi:hypothetical protein